MTELSWPARRKLVYKRAGGICEYCRSDERNIGQALHVDHINPLGGDDIENLCLACLNCNGSKHKATTALDPVTQTVVALFNPRTQVWAEHFRWIAGATQLYGITPTARATIARLRMNRAIIVAARLRWVQAGNHPPD